MPPKDFDVIVRTFLAVAEIQKLDGFSWFSLTDFEPSSSEMADKVAKMLLEMEAAHKHNEIFKAMVFPDSAKMREKREEAVVKANYSCSDISCDFSNALLAIERDARLLKYRTKDVCTAIVNDINEYQDDYLPMEVDGYFINRMGHELVHLKRDGSDGKGVTGFIEYNDLRKQSMDYYDIQKLNAINYAMSTASKNSTSAGCSVM